MKRAFLALALGILGVSLGARGFAGPTGPGGAGGGPPGFGRGGPDARGFEGFPGMPRFEGSGATMADPKVLQKDLGASREEWAVIWPKLRNIMHLRAEVEATLLDATTSVGIDMMMLGAPGMPGGGNSLEGPAAQAGGSGAMGMPAIGGMFGNGKGPFAAPPVKSGGPGGMPGGMGGFGPPEGGGFGDMLNASEGNAVKALLLELQTLIADRSTPENQLKEKLETIRATRLKSKQALQSAETDVMLLLTTKQIAALMSLGYLD